mgnify:CR=1 FL=1
MTGLNITFQTPKGSVDIVNDEYDKLEVLSETIRKVLKKMPDAIGMETPVFEYRNILMDKYGEEAEDKLVYNIETENEENQLSLRYDLTVPLIRYLVENRILKMKRYQIGKVYRKDTPSLSNGRYREFYQYDYDIIGKYPDSELEILLLINSVLNEIKQITNNNFTPIIRVNDINTLLKLYKKLKIPEELCAIVSTSIDKLDKYDRIYIKNELLNKGLSDDTINLLYDNIDNNWGFDITEYKNILQICSNFGLNIVWDPSLVRGLSYYTGLIYEVTILEYPELKTVIAGGRYDDIITKYLHNPTPAIGVSFGITRLLKLFKQSPSLSSSPKVYVTTLGSIPLLDKWKLIILLQNKGFKVYYSSGSMSEQIKYCFDNSIDLMYILGESEFSNGLVIRKILSSKTSITIPLNSL